MNYLITNHYNIRELNIDMNAWNILKSLPKNSLKLPHLFRIYLNFGQINIDDFAMIISYDQKFKTLMQNNAFIEIDLDITITEENLWTFYKKFYEFVTIIQLSKINEINIKIDTNIIHCDYFVKLHIDKLLMWQALSITHNINFWVSFGMKYSIYKNNMIDIQKLEQHSKKFETEKYQINNELFEQLYVKL